MNERKPEPWHEADEKPAAGQRKSGPIGTHSLTGGSAEVGLPPTEKDVERGDRRDEPDPDPLAEPRATGGGLPGPKP